MRCRKQDCFSCPYPDCINDYVPPVRKVSPETIQKLSRRMSALRRERASNGLCTECGKRPPREGYKMCHLCQAKARSYKNDENRRKGVTPKDMLDGVHLCQKCGKAPPAPPYKLCARCLEGCREHLLRTPTHNGRRAQSGFVVDQAKFWRHG